MAGGHNVPAIHFFFAKKSQFLYETLDLQCGTNLFMDPEFFIIVCTPLTFLDIPKRDVVSRGFRRYYSIE